MSQKGVHGFDQYGAERFGRLIFATIRKSVGLKGLRNSLHISAQQATSESGRLYHVWSVAYTGTAGVLHRTRIRDINHLKARLVEEWQRFDQKITDLVIKQSEVKFIHSRRRRAL